MDKRKIGLILIISLFSVTTVFADSLSPFQTYLPIILKPENTQVPSPTPVPMDYEIVNSACALYLIDPVQSIFGMKCVGTVRNNTRTPAILIVTRIVYDPYYLHPYEYWTFVDTIPLDGGETSTFTLLLPFGDVLYGEMTVKEY